jgi:FtsP/CotA-like multicopper oxidase with cupredoxin domain
MAARAGAQRDLVVFLRAGANAADYTIHIAPVSLEIGPNTVIKATGYNGSVPGPTLRFKEGDPVRIKVVNDSGYPNLIHWHGLYTLPLEDGAIEEGSALIAPAIPIPMTTPPSPPVGAGIIASP